MKTNDILISATNMLINQVKIYKLDIQEIWRIMSKDNRLLVADHSLSNWKELFLKAFCIIKVLGSGVKPKRRNYFLTK